ncbi:hypothetical protein Tco_1493552 [Tanacetum coccineum]
MVPRAVLMESGLVSVNTVRQVNVAHSKTTVNAARLMSYLSKIAHSTVKRPIHKNTTFKNNNINQRVNTARDKKINTARPKAVVNAVKGNNFNAVKASACWVWKIKTKVLNHVSKHNSASITLKKFDYVDAQGRSKSKDETSGILKSFITGIENLVGSQEAVNTACYVQNRVLVVKPHNKTPYELFHGRTPTLSFMRPFGCPVTILNTIDHLGKFDGSGPDWLFDIDALTRTMNYEPIVADNILLPLWTADLPYSQDPRVYNDDWGGSIPSSDDGQEG